MSRVPKMRRLIAGAVASVLLLMSTPSRASDAAEAEEVLVEEEGRATLWWYGWTFGFTAVAIGNGIGWATLRDDELRAQARVTTLTAGLGALATLIAPFPAKSAGSRLRAMKADTAEQRVEKARMAEALLVETASSEALGTSWLPHAGALLVNGAAALYVYRHDGYGRSGALLFAVGMLVAEAKIFTQPTAARDARVRLGVGFDPCPATITLFAQY